MKKILIFVVVLVWIESNAQLKPGQLDRSHVPIAGQHYLPEYTFDKPSQPDAWNKQNPGLNVGFATTDELYLRAEIPAVQGANQSWKSSGWRNERLNAQILIWSPDTLHQVRYQLHDLVSAKGQSISAKSLSIYMVRYVVSNYPYASKKATCDVVASDSAYLMPDRFEALDRFDLPGKTVRPLWLSVDIPAATEPGIYQGTVEVNSDKQHATLSVSIEVQPQTLPAPKDWKFRLDLWQNPWVVASYYQVKPWAEEHLALLKKHLQPYADAGGKYITTYAVHSPWSDNSYAVEGGMIEWIKRKDSGWKFDYSIFDQYVQLAMDCGIDKAITLYTPIPWGYRFRYIDEASGNYVEESWAPASEAFKQHWTIFLDDLKLHLDSKGWFDKTYIGINENPLEQTLAAARVIKEHGKKFSKGWKITYAGDWHPELREVLDDYSPVISSEPNQVELNARKAQGLTTTFYVCCTPQQPNNFVFSPPVEGTYIGWYAAAFGYDGFLRWAYDAWPADPMRDARHTLWPAGDCFLIYPGGASDIRFEKLREGIVDYEKIRILREMVSQSRDKKINAQWKAFEKHLTTFLVDRDYGKRDYNVGKMKEQIEVGKRMMGELSLALSH